MKSPRIAPIVLVANGGSTKVGAIHDILRKQGATTLEWTLFEENPLPGQMDAIVLSGGPHLYTDNPALIEGYRFLDQTRVPVLGICLGHQALGIQAGAEVFLGKERRGEECIQKLAEHPLFDGLESSFQCATDHVEGITLPSGYRRLATSDHYEVEAMASLTQPRYGVQFHPEVSGTVGDKIFENFLTITLEQRDIQRPR
jgi:GMP synthase-like glutamine amidotransferase